MRGLWGRAFGNARVRAMKSRLRTPEDLRLFRAASSVAALASAAEIETPCEARELTAGPFADLLADYQKLMDAYPAGASLFRALLQLHEIENLKLGWRASARSLPANRWAHLWKPLGRHETLRLSCWRESASLRDAASCARGTPYEGIARDAFRAHEADEAAAELAFDRWAWSSLVAEARRLPRREGEAKRLALSRVRERDFDALRRAISSYGLSADAAGASTVLLREEENPERLRGLAQWAPGAGPLARELPRLLSLGLPAAGGWDDLFLALRRQRREDCLRAFRGYPFRLAPPLAYLLLREEENRGYSALAESRGKPETAPALERVLAASAMSG